MRRIVAISWFVFFATGIFGQAGVTPTLNWNSLERKMEKSNEEIMDERKRTRDKTWLDRAELFLDIHDVNIEFVRLGMSAQEAQLYLEEPIETKTLENGRVMHVHERINLIFENDVLVDYEETEVLHEDPLPVALEAFEKTLELDDRGRRTDDVKEGLDRLKRQAETDAILAYQDQDYEEAVRFFELVIDASETGVYGENFHDSVIIYNAALAARNGGMHEKSAELFEKATDINYGGSDTYYLLAREYYTMKDSLKALNALQRGFESYPDSTIMIFELVNYYLGSGNTEEGTKFLNLALEKDPDNPSVHFAMGTMHERAGDMEKAEAAYKNSVEIDPEYFNSWFNLGALYFNRAVTLYDEANTKEDLDEYKKAREIADAELKKAIPALKKAHEIKPEDKDTLETLSTIYYRLQMEEERAEIQKLLDEL